MLYIWWLFDGLEVVLGFNRRRTKRISAAYLQSHKLPSDGQTAKARGVRGVNQASYHLKSKRKTKSIDQILCLVLQTLYLSLCTLETLYWTSAVQLMSKSSSKASGKYQTTKQQSQASSSIPSSTYLRIFFIKLFTTLEDARITINESKEKWL